MVMLPAGTKESYGMKCASCGYTKIIHGESIFSNNVLSVLLKKIKPPSCPRCGGKLTKDNSVIIAH